MTEPSESRVEAEMAALRADVRNEAIAEEAFSGFATGAPSYMTWAQIDDGARDPYRRRARLMLLRADAVDPVRAAAKALVDMASDRFVTGKRWMGWDDLAPLRAALSSDDRTHDGAAGMVCRVGTPGDPTTSTTS